MPYMNKHNTMFNYILLFYVSLYVLMYVWYIALQYSDGQNNVYNAFGYLDVYMYQDSYISKIKKINTFVHKFSFLLFC